jgi:hypothetical protein
MARVSPWWPGNTPFTGPRTSKTSGVICSPAAAPQAESPESAGGCRAKGDP